MKARFLFAALCISALAWADHLRLTIDRPAGVGVASHFIVVERFTDAGTPLTSGALSATVSTNSPTGQFHSQPWFVGGWQDGGTYALNIGNGGSNASFVYRDVAVGTHDLSVSAAGYAAVSAPITVETTLLSENFEGRILPLESPPGIWEFQDVQPGNALDFSAQGAHWGDGGLYHVDNTNLPDAGGEAIVGVFTAYLTDPLYLRGWVRRSATTPGSTTLAVMHSSGGPIFSLEATAAGELALAGTTANGYPWQSFGLTLQPTSWYLVNAKITGLGTTSGRRAVFIGDAGTFAQSSLDFTGLDVQSLFLGNSWGDPRSFTGNISWDDFRVSTVPQGDTLVATVPATISTSACTPITVWIRSTLDAVDTQAPYDVDAQLGVEKGALHLLPDCGDAPVQAVRIPKGQLSGTAYLLGGGEVGAVDLRLSHPDFLSSTSPFTFVTGAVDGGGGDAGATDGGSGAPQPRAGSFDVGCGCSSAVPLFPLALVALLRARRARS